MALFFDLTQPSGDVSRIELTPGIQRLRVIAGDRYRIIDDQGNPPPGLMVRRYDNHLLIDHAQSDVQVELTDYYGRCSVSTPCVLEVSDGAGAVVEISPASEPIRALTDGSFVLYQGGADASPLSPLAAPSDGAPAEWGAGNGWMIGGGLLGLAAVAGLAGGGGSSNPPTAIGESPVQPPAPTPGPAPAPAPDTTPPGAPEVTSGTVSNHARPVIVGKAEAGSTVRASIDIGQNGTADLVYETRADANGDFLLDLATATPTSGRLPASGLPDGQVAVTVVAIDASNNASQPYVFPLQISATAPSTPSITGVVDDVGARTGAVTNGGTTDDLTPTVSGRLADPLEAGSRIVVLRNGVEIAVTPTVNGTNWTFQDSGLQMGQTYVYEVRVINAVGNASEISNGWQIHTRADPAPTVEIARIVDNAAPQTGNVANGAATNDRTPTIHGTISEPLGAGQTIQVLRNGTVTTLRPTVSGTTFTVTDTLTQDGNYSYTVRVVDNGTAGPASAPHVIVLDTANTTRVVVETVVDNQAPVTGVIQHNGATDDRTPTVTGSLSAPLGAGEVIEILRNGRVVGTVEAAPGGRWSYEDSGLAVATYSYTARVVDAAGNVGPAGNTYVIRVVVSQREVEAGAEVEVEVSTGPLVPAEADPLVPASASAATAATVPGGPAGQPVQAAAMLTLADLVGDGSGGGGEYPVTAGWPLAASAASGLERLIDLPLA